MEPNWDEYTDEVLKILPILPTMMILIRDTALGQTCCQCSGGNHCLGKRAVKKARICQSFDWIAGLFGIVIRGGAYNKLCCSEDEKKENDNDAKKTIFFEANDRHTDVESNDSSCSELDFEDDLSQDSDYEENLTCNVCDRFFCSQGQLSAHQQKKRHFGCSSCDSLFPSLMALEHHKEEFEHWTGSEGPHSEESDRDPSTHEMERLL